MIEQTPANPMSRQGYGLINTLLQKTTAAPRKSKL